MRRMHSRWPAVLPFVLLVLALSAIVSCGSGGGDAENTATTYTTQDWQNLYDHNAAYNSGRTIRWPGAIPTYDIHSESFRRWEEATGGKVQFQFVADQPTDGISIWLGIDLPDDTAGLTEVRFNTAKGEIVQATIYVHPRRWNSEDAPYVLTHEAGHAIGFLGHSDDGCIMDPQMGSGDCISDAVARIVTHLYSYPPHTDVNAYLPNALLAYPPIQKDDGSLSIPVPGGHYFVKPLDRDTILLSSGPFYTGPVESLPELQP